MIIIDLIIKDKFMSISELLEKAKASAKLRTHEQNIALLKEAHILDENGIYDSKYFSQETVSKDIERSKKSNV